MESNPIKKRTKKANNGPHGNGTLLIVIATLFTAAGLTLLKLGMNETTPSLVSYFNFYLILGAILYILSAILLILGLKRGNLSTLYPLVSLNYVWIILISILFFEESMPLLKILGCTSIVLGVSLLGIKGDNSKKSNPKQKTKRGTSC